MLCNTNTIGFPPSLLGETRRTPLPHQPMRCPYAKKRTRLTSYTAARERSLSGAHRTGKSDSAEEPFGHARVPAVVRIRPHQAHGSVAVRLRKRTIVIREARILNLRRVGRRDAAHDDVARPRNGSRISAEFCDHGGLQQESVRVRVVAAPERAGKETTLELADVLSKRGDGSPIGERTDR
jgi:hypothetical protein